MMLLGRLLGTLAAVAATLMVVVLDVPWFNLPIWRGEAEGLAGAQAAEVGAGLARPGTRPEPAPGRAREPVRQAYL